MRPIIQVVINTWNRSNDLVSRSVKSALTQIPPVEKVILIDQNSAKTSLPPEIVSDPRFSQVSSKTGAVSRARNEILGMNLSGWIIFCDDDGYLAADYVERFIKLILKYPEVEVFAGSIVRDDNGNFYSVRHKKGGNMNLFPFSKLLMGSNFCVRADVFGQLRGFDERFGAGAFWGSGEETDFAWKALFSGAKMHYAQELKVFHVRPYSLGFRKSCLKAFSYGRGKGALVAKWLLEERQIKVSYELLEMILLPWVQFVAYLLMFQGKRAIYCLFSWLGRVRGLFEFSFRYVLVS